MGGAVYFCLFEAVLSVVDPGFHDRFTIRAFDVMLTCTVIFSGVGTVCGGVIYEWRRQGATGAGNLFKIFWKYMKWYVLLLLKHLSLNMLRYDMQLSVPLASLSAPLTSVCNNRKQRNSNVTCISACISACTRQATC